MTSFSWRRIVEELNSKMIETLRDAARKLTSSKHRAFEASVSLDYSGGDTRLTETVFGWSRHTVAKGIKEHASGHVIEGWIRYEELATKAVESSGAQINFEK